MKEAYAIYISFRKMVFYLKDTYVMILYDHSPLQSSVYPL